MRQPSGGEELATIAAKSPPIDLVFRPDGAHPPYAPTNGTLIPVNGAKLATLGTNEWHVADRVPLAELRQRIADSPIDSFRLVDDKVLLQSGLEEAVRQRPILAVETADGSVATLRISTAFPDGLDVTIRPRPLAPNPPFHPGDRVVAAETESSPNDGSRAHSAPETNANAVQDDRVHINIITARHALLLEGREVVTWADIEAKIKALPDPSRAFPHLYVTRGAMEAGLEDAADAVVNQFHRKYNLQGHSIGSLSPRTDVHYDRIVDPEDLVPDPALRREGVVVDQDGAPIAGAEVVLVTPVDESIPYKTYDIYIVSGELRNPLDEVLTRTDDAGRFAVHPPRGTPFSLLAIHPDAGIALVEAEWFAKEPQLKLLPWGSVVAEFSKEPEEQEASLRTSLPASETRPEISISQHWSDLKRPDPTLTFEFTHVPPIWQTSISRQFRQPDGGSTGVPGASVSVLPGEKREVSLGPVTEQQREQIERIRNLFRSRAEAAPDKQDGAETASKTEAGEASAEKSSGSKSDNQASSKSEDTGSTTTVTGLVLDDAGDPVSRAQVEAHAFRSTHTVNTNDDGRFMIAVTPDDLRGLNFLARSVDRQQMGIRQFGWNAELEVPPVVTVHMQPALQAVVHVLDSDGEPVAGAKVDVRMNHHCHIAMRTDAEGAATIMLPADAAVHEVLATKDGFGLDYKSWFVRNRAARRQEQIPPDLSETIELVLTKPNPLTVTVTDADADEPISDVPVSVWLFQKPGEPDSLNVAYYQEDLRANTDAHGVAIIDWLPKWLADSRVVINAHSQAHEYRRTEHTVVGQADALTIKLHRLVPLRGRVSFPDGRPAPGFSIKITGEGYEHERFRALPVTTDDDGRYEFNVSPNQAYLVLVDDEQWAAPPATGFVVLPGQPRENVDFVLRPATRLYGRVTMGPNERPITGQQIYSYQEGATVNLKEAGVPLPDGADQIWANPSYVRVTKSNRDGRFELFVGPGKYDLRGPTQNEIERFEITTETEREFNFHAPRPESGPFSGLVVAGDPLQPVVNAKVTGIYRHQLAGMDIDATTDADGRFGLTRELHGVAMQAVSEDGTQAAIVEVGPDDEAVTFNLQPHAVASGRLIDGETGEVLPNATIQYKVNVHLGGKDDPWRSSFGGTTKTDADGNFTLDRLVAGTEFHVTLVAGRDDNGYANRWRHITRLLPKTPGETIDLGDTVVQPPPKPYKPPTIDERIASAFHKKDVAATRYQNNLRDVRIGHLRQLMILADPEAELTRQLFELRYDDDQVRALTDNYWLLPLPLTGEKGDDTRAFISSLGIEVSDPAAPVLIVIDEQESRRATVEAADLAPEGAIDKQKVIDFLTAYAPEQLDAQVLLDDALARAKAENKRVFVQESATWCGPCWMLSRFIAAHRDVLEQDYIFVKLDHRWPHAREIGEKFRNGEHSGIPWSAILDGAGTILATSDGPDGNIGFPSKSEPSGIEHFLKMLRETRIRLTDGDLEGIGAALRGEDPPAAKTDSQQTALKTSPTQPQDQTDRDTADSSVPVQCVDADGRPVAGAEVYVFQYTGGDDDGRYEQSGPLTTDAEGRITGVAAVVRDDEGHFDRFFYARVPEKLVGVGRSANWKNRAVFNPEGRIEMRPSRSIEVFVSVPEGADPTAITVRAQSMTVYTGTRDFDFQMWTREDRFPGLDTALSNIFERRVRPDGRVQFSDVPVRGRLTLLTVGEGFGEAQWFNSGAPNFDEPITLRVRKEAVLAGQVITPDGKPAADIEVLARISLQARSYTSTFRASTDANGLYEIRGLPQTKLNVSVELGQTTGVMPPRERVVVRSGGTETLDLQLETGVAVTGRAVDEIGAPIAGAAVSALTDTEEASGLGHKMSADDGRFTLLLPSGGAQFYFNSLPDGFAYPVPQIFKKLDIKPGQEAVDLGDIVLKKAGETSETAAAAESSEEPESASATAGDEPDSDQDPDGGSKMLREIRRKSKPLLAALAEKHGYSLEEGQDVKRVPMPFDPARMEFYRVGHPGQSDAIPAGPTSMLFHWDDGELNSWGMSFGDRSNPGRSITGLADWVLDLKSQNVEGPEDLLKQVIPGDWVLRLGASEESRLEQLNEILKAEADWPVRLAFRTVKRPVYVATGDYELTPLPGKSGEDRTQLTDGERVSDKVFIFASESALDSGGNGGGCGDFDEFLAWLGRWIESPIVNQIETWPTRGLCWSLHESSSGTAAQRKADHDPELVLANITKQTGLTFRKRNQDVRILFAEDAESE